MPYAPTVKYVKGSDLHIADALSRDCDQTDETDETDESEDAIVHAVLSMSDETTNRYVRATENDVELRALTKLIQEGWPENIRSMSPQLKHYQTFKEEIEWVDGLLFKGEKLIVPLSERPKCLESIHNGHPGIVNSIKRAKQFVYWRGMSSEIKNMVERCSVCQETQRDNDKLPIYCTEILSYPFELVSTDLFQYKKNDYIAIADRYSGFLDFRKLKAPNSHEVIKALKSWFSVHGIPRMLKSDNGT